MPKNMYLTDYGISSIYNLLTEPQKKKLGYMTEGVFTVTSCIFLKCLIK